MDTGFDRIAPVYDRLAFLVFGHTLQKAQAHWLHRMPPQADVLIIGGGSGWLLRRVLDDCHPRKVIYIDASRQMVDLARRAVQDDSRVHFRVGNETLIDANEPVDAVMTPFLLDLFTEARLQNDLLPRLDAALRTGGYWFSTDFIQSPGWWQSGLLRLMYAFFRTVSGIEARHLPNWPLLLEQALDLQPRETTAYFGGMILTGYWQKRSEQTVYEKIRSFEQSFL